MKGLILIFLMLFTTTSAFAEGGIQPFGGILWTDDFIQVAQKMSSMGGDIFILQTNERKNGVGIDLKNTAIDKSSLTEKLVSSVVKDNPGIFNPENHRKFGFIFRNYINLQGVENQLVGNRDYILFMSPILVKGVPFSLKAFFTPHVGLDVVNPDAVLIEKVSGYTFPLILTKIELLSKSPSLIENYKEIDKILEQKYIKYAPLGERNLLWNTNFGDKKGSYLYIDRARTNPKSYKISYSSDKYTNELSESYRKHLANLESRKTKNAMDMGSSL